MAKNKRHVWKRPDKSCENCARCEATGSGEHICQEAPDRIVFENYAAADDYYWCAGTEWVAG